MYSRMTRADIHENKTMLPFISAGQLSAAACQKTAVGLSMRLSGIKTVELVVEKIAWQPPAQKFADNDRVPV